MTVDPFRDSEIARIRQIESDVKSDARTPKLGGAGRSTKEKLRETTVSRSVIKQNMTPTGLEPVLPA